MKTGAVLLVLSACGLAACGSSSGTASDAGASDAGAGDGGADGGALPRGAPITAPSDVWTWVDFPDSACDDGSTTGLGVNLHAGAQGTLLFLNGGGACWDYLTCFVSNTAVHGPFGAAQLTPISAAVGTGFDRTVADNPFKSFNYVFVPYCTGDLHGGDNVITYTSGTQSRSYHHVGRANMRAYLARLVATLPAAGKLVVAGSSAGGFGATINYDLVRRYFPGADMTLIDDSGPLLPGDGIPAAIRAAWFASWHLGDVLDPLCSTCRADLSQLMKSLATRYPGDRMALLSSLQDAVIRAYSMQTASAFQTSLLDLAAGLEPLPNARYFFVAGMTHTMLGSPTSFSGGGLTLNAWLTAQLSGGAWVSTKP